MHNRSADAVHCTMSSRFVLRLFLIVHCALCIVHSSQAQSKRAQDLYQQGVTLFRERKPNEAIPFFQQAVKESPTYLDAHMQLGMAYEYTRKPEQALGAYKQIIALQPNPAVAGQAYQQTASILLRLGRYAEAIPVLEAYSHNFAPQSSKAKQIQRGLATARFGMDALAHPVSVQPKPLAESLNVGQSQYFPVLTADEQTIVFTMLKPEGDEDLMTATQASEGGWQAPTPLSTNISTPDNEGTATLSADGRLLVFTACQSSGTRQGFGSCDLFSSQNRRHLERPSEPGSYYQHPLLRIATEPLGRRTSALFHLGSARRYWQT